MGFSPTGTTDHQLGDEAIGSTLKMIAKVLDCYIREYQANIYNTEKWQCGIRSYAIISVPMLMH